MIPNETRSKKEILQTKTYEVVRNVVLDGGYPVTRCYLQGGSRDEREREISCSLSGGPTQQWRDLLGL